VLSSAAVPPPTRFVPFVPNERMLPPAILFLRPSNELASTPVSPLKTASENL
jgi:hypothetical protein